MIKYKSYPAYMHSNIFWIRDIPAHWGIKKVKHLADFHTGWTPPSGNDEYYDGEYPWANISDLGAKYLERTAKTITQEAVDSLRIRLSKKGSLLFSFKLSIGLVSLLTKDMYTNEAIATFQPSDKISTQYLYYSAPVAIPMNAGINIYNAPMLNQESIKNALLVYPPVAEQQAIAAFLDRETARIDALIQKQERMIELLKEKRIALITQAVTKGLDPTVKMKDSGIEWLGEVPEGWNLNRIKNLTKLITNKSTDEELEYIGLEHIQSNTGKKFESDFEPLADEVIEFQRGDVLYGKLRPYLNKVFLTNQKGRCSSEFFVLKYHSILNDFAFFYMLSDSFCSVVNSSTYGAKMPRANWGFTSNLVMTIPSEKEQKSIASFLYKETTKIDCIIQKRERAIELLREYRASLIHHAVTGKIDLRDHDVPTQ